MNGAIDIDVTDEDTVQGFWNEHVAWSKVANQLKAQRSRWGTTVLLLTVIGATLQMIAATEPTLGFIAGGIGSTEPTLRLIVGGIGTIALALVPIFAGNFLTAQQTAKWLRARSISEGIKSEVYTYRAGAEPYIGENGLNALRTKVRAIRDFGKDLQLERTEIGAPTEAGPPTLNATAYINERVWQQIEEYYRPKAQTYARRARQFRGIEIGFASLAAVLSAIATLAPSLVVLGAWVAVITTIGGTIAAHAAANRYDFQATTFFATARQLGDLIDDWKAAGKPSSPKEWSGFVRSWEEAISAENRAWMAKLDERKESQEKV